MSARNDHLGPAFVVLAGPNGAGKSTLYRNELRGRFPSVEFVNADLLAQDYFGHAARTLEQSRAGHRLVLELHARALVRIYGEIVPWVRHLYEQVPGVC